MKFKIIFAFLYAAMFLAGCGGEIEPLIAVDGDADEEIADVESAPSAFPLVLPLTDWMLSAKTDDRFADVAAAGFDDSAWTPAKAPGTVLGAQVDAGQFGDPFYGETFKSLPGYGPSYLPMPGDSPYREAYWLRTEIDLPAETDSRYAVLTFEGINYRADIWMNGRQVAGADEVAGTFRRWDFNVGERLRPGAPNALAVQVFAPDVYNLAITWVDWSPAPPDRNMGLWAPVALTVLDGPIDLRYPTVLTRLNNHGWAELTVIGELANLSDKTVTAVIHGVIDGVGEFIFDSTVGGGKIKPFAIAPDDAGVLRVGDPRLWWPYGYGEPALYEIAVSVSVDQEPSDKERFAFGIREIDAGFNEYGWLEFSVNGVPIQILGGGYAPDLFLRRDPARDATELAYVKEMGLNTIRLEGKLMDDAFLDECDRLGILVMAGWCCCDMWEFWNSWEDEHKEVAHASLHHQARRLRRHPSVFVWLNGSDYHPPEEIERMYRDTLAQADWPNPVIASADDDPSEFTGPTGVKMTGPYDWTPPAYWRSDSAAGGAFGFNTETGPGPAIPVTATLEEIFPANKRWPINETWTFHAGGGEFRTLGRFTEALEARLGPASNLADFQRKAQYMHYESERAMFEAYSERRFKATGLIQWMLNNAWPSVIWHLYDYNLRPSGGYYGVKKALEPVHIQWAENDKTVWAVNQTRDAQGPFTATARVYSYDMRALVAVSDASVILPPHSAVEIFALAPTLAEITDKLSPEYFIWLALTSPEEEMLSRNVYVQPTATDELDWIGTEWFWTPTHLYADLTELADLPRTAVQSNVVSSVYDGATWVSVAIANTSANLAFQIVLTLLDDKDKDVIPTFWSENYLSLMPGERILVTGRTDRVIDAPTVLVSGWNVDEMRLKP